MDNNELLDKFKSEHKEEIEEAQKEPEEAPEQTTDIVAQEDKTKSLTDVSLKDIKVKMDDTQSYEKQAEDMLNMRSVLDVAKDEDTGKVLMSQKKSQMIDKARKKTKDAQKEVIQSETEIQKAEHENLESILETFGFFEHMPHWMMKAIVYTLTPFYFIIGLVIGIPCGFIKILIDNIDGIILTYDDKKAGSKPKIKVTIIILFVIAILAAIVLITLGCLHII